MAVISAIAWPLRLLAVGLVTAGLGTGVYFLAQADDDGDEPRVVVAGTATAGASSPTQPPPGVTETPPPAETQAPTAPPPSAVPTLEPPPPKPDQPTEVQGGEWGSLLGGQWLRLLGCYDFYLPVGRTFALQIIAADPGGALIVFTEASSGASISFWRDSLAEQLRTEASGEVGLAFDQIAATISTIC
jgi:hypothetical protein